MMAACRCCCVLQGAVVALARFCTVVFVNEYWSSRKCSTCKREGGTDASFMTKSPSNPRNMVCRTCGEVNRDVNASRNLRAVAEQWMADRTRPRYLDSPAAFQYSRSVDPEGWTAFRVPTATEIADGDLVAMGLARPSTAVRAPPARALVSLAARVASSRSRAPTAATAPTAPGDRGGGVDVDVDVDTGEM